MEFCLKKEYEILTSYVLRINKSQECTYLVAGQIFEKIPDKFN